jgi:hypothetical protein
MYLGRSFYFDALEKKYLIICERKFGVRIWDGRKGV